MLFQKFLLFVLIFLLKLKDIKQNTKLYLYMKEIELVA